MIRAGGLVRNPSSTVRFLEEQLAYDTRELKEAEERTRVLRDALTLYTQKPANVFADTQTGQNNSDPSSRSGQTVMPQLGESFLDRLVNMTGELADREYRQKMVDDIKDAGLSTVPLLSLVQYDKQLIETVKRPVPSDTPTAEAEQTVQRQFDAIYADVSKTIGDINEIYVILSRNLNPSTELFTLTSPPQAADGASHLPEKAVPVWNRRVSHFHPGDPRCRASPSSFQGRRGGGIHDSGDAGLAG